MKLFHKAAILPTRNFWTRMLPGCGLACMGPLMITWVLVHLPYLHAPFLLYFIFALLLARFFPFGVVLLATALSALLANYFFLPPIATLSLGGLPGSYTALFALATSTSAAMLRSGLQSAVRERAHAALMRQMHDALEQERQKVERAFLQAPAAIVINGGDDWRYEFINERAQDLMPPGINARGVPLAKIMPALAEEVIPLLNRVREQKAPMIVREYPLTLYVNGTTERRICDFTYQPVFTLDGSVDSVMTFCVDVHDAVTARREMEMLAAERGDDLRAHDDFIAIAAHELKTPVTALLLQVQILQRRLGTATPIPQAAIVRSVDRQVELLCRLIHLIETLLDATRITEGRLELRREEVWLDELITDVVERLWTMAADAGSTLRVVEAAKVVGALDRLRLEQVLTNLITNAIKYGDGKPIEIIADTVGEQARFRIVDHGIGICKEDHDRIFKRFERVRARGATGMGLGLWITRRLITAMGGSLSVASSPGKGSTFTVWLPLACEETTKSSIQNANELDESRSP